MEIKISQMYSSLVGIVFVDVHVPVVFTGSPNLTLTFLTHHCTET